MRHALFLALAVPPYGCSCAVPGGLTVLGVAGAVVIGDPAHAIAPGNDVSLYR